MCSNVDFWTTYRSSVARNHAKERLNVFADSSVKPKHERETRLSLECEAYRSREPQKVHEICFFELHLLWERERIVVLISNKCMDAQTMLLANMHIWSKSTVSNCLEENKQEGTREEFLFDMKSWQNHWTGRWENKQKGGTNDQSHSRCYPKVLPLVLTIRNFLSNQWSNGKHHKEVNVWEERKSLQKEGNKGRKKVGQEVQRYTLSSHSLWCLFHCPAYKSVHESCIWRGRKS